MDFHFLINEFHDAEIQKRTHYISRYVVIKHDTPQLLPFSSSCYVALTSAKELDDWRTWIAMDGIK